MSESVGLRYLLRRKINEMNSNLPCYGKFMFGTAYGERECYTCPCIDSCIKQVAENAALETKYAEGGIVPGAKAPPAPDLPGEQRHLSSNALHVPGAKDDKAKPMAGVLLDFSRALQSVVDVGTYGAKKYTRTGWATVPEGSQRYLDAMMRHLLAMDVDPDGLDKETGLPHLAHVAWNALAVLELQARRKETF